MASLPRRIARLASGALLIGALIASASPAGAATAGYYIKNADGKCLEIENSSRDNGAHAQQWSCVGQEGAVWYAEQVANGGWPAPVRLRIRNYYSNKCLVIENSSNSNGAGAVLWDCNGQAGSLWSANVGQQTNWYYWWQNAANGKCLEIENSSFSNGARAQQWDCVGQGGANWLQWVQVR